MSTAANRRSPLLQTLRGAFPILWLVVAAFPFLWTQWGSFKVEGDFFPKACRSNAIFGTLTRVETGGRSRRRAATGRGCRKDSGAPR